MVGVAFHLNKQSCLGLLQKRRWNKRNADVCPLGLVCLSFLRLSSLNVKSNAGFYTCALPFVVRNALGNRLLHVRKYMNQTMAKIKSKLTSLRWADNSQLLTCPSQKQPIVLHVSHPVAIMNKSRWLITACIFLGNRKCLRSRPKPAQCKDSAAIFSPDKWTLPLQENAFLKFSIFLSYWYMKQRPCHDCGAHQLGYMLETVPVNGVPKTVFSKSTPHWLFSFLCFPAYFYPSRKLTDGNKDYNYYHYHSCCYQIIYSW